MSSIPTHAPIATIPNGAGSAFSRWAAGAVRRVQAIAKALRNRRDVSRLLELDERTLKDIGLVRNDVVGVLETPLSCDPSVLLRLRAVEHRAKRRKGAAPLRSVIRSQRCEA